MSGRVQYDSPAFLRFLIGDCPYFNAPDRGSEHIIQAEGAPYPIGPNGEVEPVNGEIPEGATTMLHCDLIAGIRRLEYLEVGPPYLVRPVGGNSNALVRSVYGDNIVGLELCIDLGEGAGDDRDHSNWHIDGDKVGSDGKRTIEAINSNLITGITNIKLEQIEGPVVILFHDIHGVTTDNFEWYLQTIVDTFCSAQNRCVKFVLP